MTALRPHRRTMAALVTVAALAFTASACSVSVDTAGGGGTSGDSPTPTGASSPTETTGEPTTEPATDPSTPSATPATPASPEPSSLSGSRKPDVSQLRLARSTPVEDPYYPETSNPEVDTLHYGLDLTYTGRRLTGVATVTFRTTERRDDVRLGLSGALRVAGIAVDGQRADFTRSGDALIVTAASLSDGRVHTARIRYSGVPRPTSAPSGRGDLAGGLGWTRSADGTVHTFQEPYGAFTWYPVHDHPSDKALYDARIRTRSPAVGVFNGQLTGRRSVGGTTVTSWHVDEPVASYLVTIAIGPYREYRDRVSQDRTIAYWLMPQDRRLLPKLRREGRSAYAWLTDTAGPYPFSTLGVVVVGGESAMETQTMITMSRGAVERPDAVLQHEMAHQWYGDSVTPRDWTALWLNEGWAMYMQQAYERDLRRYTYAGGIEFWRDLDNQSRQQSGPPASYDPQTFGDLNVYLGPALMLDRIRMRIGDAAFARLVKAWPVEHENRNVDRETFTRWVNAKTGRDLTPLIDTWLDSPRTPR